MRVEALINLWTGRDFEASDFIDNCFEVDYYSQKLVLFLNAFEATPERQRQEWSSFSRGPSCSSCFESSFSIDLPAAISLLPILNLALDADTILSSQPLQQWQQTHYIQGCTKWCGAYFLPARIPTVPRLSGRTS